MSNIIIMNLSSLRKNSVEEKYESDLGTITGTNTADAPLKYLIEYIKQKNEKTDKILTVVTPEAESSFEALKNMLASYDPKLPEPCEIKGTDMLSVVNKILSLVEKNDKIYIEATGGIRNTTYTLMTIVRILEYSGVTLEKAVYSNYSSDKTKTNIIEDITDTYRMFNLINAANSFTSYGNSNELEKYYADSDNEIIKDTIRAMRDFSDDITLCRTSNLESTLDRLNLCLDTLSNTSPGTKDAAFFQPLADVIRKKFYMDNKKKIEYTDIVRWCADNKLIQQAVTIYTEKIPEYFYDKKYFTVSKEETENRERNNENSNYNLKYEIFYQGFMSETYSDPTVKIFRQCRPVKNDKLSIGSAKKTDEEIIFTALAECDNLTVFLKRVSGSNFKKYRFDEQKKELTNYFKVKRAAYDNSNENSLRPDIQKRLSDLSDLPDVFKIANNKPSLFPKDVLKFPFTLSYNLPLLYAVLGIKAEYSDEHLNCIEMLDKKDNTYNYQLNPKINAEDMKEIMRDIYFAKNFIRNKLNHASEDDKNAEEKSAYFKKYGYEFELNVDSITKFIYKAIDKINETEKDLSL